MNVVEDWDNWRQVGIVTQYMVVTVLTIILNSTVDLNRDSEQKEPSNTVFQWIWAALFKRGYCLGSLKTAEVCFSSLQRLRTPWSMLWAIEGL